MLSLRIYGYIFISIYRCIEGFIWTYVPIRLHMPVCDVVYRYDLLIKFRNSAYIFMSVYRCIEGFIWTYARMHLHMPVCDIVYRYDLFIKFLNAEIHGSD